MGPPLVGVFFFGLLPWLPPSSPWECERGAELLPALSRCGGETRRGDGSFWNPTKQKGRHSEGLQQLLGQLPKQITITPLEPFPCVIKDSMCGPCQPEENRRSGGQVSPPPLLTSWRGLFHLWARETASPEVGGALPRPPEPRPSSSWARGMRKAGRWFMRVRYSCLLNGCLLEGHHA